MFRALLIIISLLYIMPHAQADVVDIHSPHLLVGSVHIHNKEAKVSIQNMQTNYSQQHTDLYSCNAAMIAIENQLIVVNPPNQRDLYGTFEKVINLSCVPLTTVFTQ